MGEMLSPVLRDMGNGYLAFWCAGCEESHVIRVRQADGERPSWTYNGDPRRPTFSPSIKVTSGHYVSGWQGPTCYCNSKAPDGEDWGFTCGICHSFVTDGRIRFLGDCTHNLAGQTIDLQPFPEGRVDG
jgi:hypothetical protein